MVESKGGYARRPTENRHEALRDLREDDVVFGNREPEGADVLVTQIAGCLVNRATANMEVDVLEPTTGPRGGFRRKIDHVRTKGSDPSRRNDLASHAARQESTKGRKNRQDSVSVFISAHG